MGSPGGASRRMGMDAGGVMPTLHLLAKGSLPYSIDQRLVLPPFARALSQRKEPRDGLKERSTGNGPRDRARSGLMRRVQTRARLGWSMPRLAVR
jgi:hypothetical protein